MSRDERARKKKLPPGKGPPPEKEKDAAPSAPPPEPALRDDVRVGGSLARCPYCHAELALATDRWVACKSCLARHHALRSRAPRTATRSSTPPPLPRSTRRARPLRARTRALSSSSRAATWPAARGRWPA